MSKKPLYPDRCGHGQEAYAGQLVTVRRGKIKREDLYFYKWAADEREWQFCARYGSEHPEYRSGPLPVSGKTGFSDSFTKQDVIDHYNWATTLLGMFLDFIKVQQLNLGYRPPAALPKESV